MKSARLFANSQNDGAKHTTVVAFLRTTRRQRGLFLLFEGSRLKKKQIFEGPFQHFQGFGGRLGGA